MKTNIEIFKIFGAYNWNKTDENQKESKNNLTVLAIKELIKQLEVRIEKSLKDSNTKLRYNRLRATAGSFLLDGIRDRIINSNAIIFDITSLNPNVMFELGIAIEASRHIKGAKVYIICEGDKFNHEKIPSDLHGYFISFYELKKNKIIFHDGNSLAMRLLSEIADLSNQAYIELEENNN
jgi:hypothetical protein